MKVENIESNKGNKIANQFVITDNVLLSLIYKRYIYLVLSVN